MESNSERTKIKLTALIVFKNQNFLPFEDGFTSILLDNAKVPSIMIDEEPNGGVALSLKKLLSKYVKFDTSFISGTIVDYKEEGDLLELIFCFNLVFVSGVIAEGSLFSKKDLVDRKIQLDERYARYF